MVKLTTSGAMMGAHSRDLGVVVIGDAVVSLAAEGPLVDASTLRRGQRGEAIVAAVQAARLGVQAALVTRVGDDVFGDWLLESWEAQGVHLDFAQRCQGRNSLELRSLAGGPHDALTYREGSVATGLDRADVEPVPWDRTRLVFATGATQALSPSARAAVSHAFDLARAAGARTVYSPTFRPGLWRGGDGAARDALEELLPLTDVLVIGAPLASGKLLATADAAEAARALGRRGVSQVVVRDAGRGCVTLERQVLRRLAADVTLGADPLWPTASFDGALLAALAGGAALQDAAAGAMRAMSATARAEAGGFDRLPSTPAQEATTS